MAEASLNLLCRFFFRSSVNIGAPLGCHRLSRPLPEWRRPFDAGQFPLADLLSLPSHAVLLFDEL